MNKHEQIVLRVWRSAETAECFRTDEHVVVHNGFSILLLNNIDKINPNWTYDHTSQGYDRCMRTIETRELNTVVHLPDMADIKATLKGRNRDNFAYHIDLTADQLDTSGKYTGCLKVNLWYLYDFMWALGDNLNAFWSGQIVYRKWDGQIRTHAKGALYLAGSNGQAMLMPIESKVSDA